MSLWDKNKSNSNFSTSDKQFSYRQQSDHYIQSVFFISYLDCIL